MSCFKSEDQPAGIIKTMIYSAYGEILQDKTDQWMIVVDADYVATLDEIHDFAEEHQLDKLLEEDITTSWTFYHGTMILNKKGGGWCKQHAEDLAEKVSALPYVHAAFAAPCRFDGS